MPPVVGVDSACVVTVASVVVVVDFDEEPALSSDPLHAASVTVRRSAMMVDVRVFIGDLAIS